MEQEQQASPGKSQNFLAWLFSLTGEELGTLAFNLAVVSWIGMNIAFLPGRIVYSPGCYITPNWLNILSAFPMVVGLALAVIAIKRSSLISPVIALTFGWSFVATLIRTAMEHWHA